MEPKFPVSGTVVPAFAAPASNASLHPSPSESKSKRFGIPSPSESNSVQVMAVPLLVLAFPTIIFKLLKVGAEGRLDNTKL